MSAIPDIIEDKIQNRKEALMFFKRWLRHPLRMGSILPSSKSLGKLVSKNVTIDDGFVIELGAGTGCLTRQLLNTGIPADRLILIELDPELCNHLKATFPQLKVFHGNAADMAHFLPKEVVGNVSSVISGLPMTTIPNPIQKKIIDGCFDVMNQKGALLQYTYRPASSISADRMGLVKSRVGVTFKNLPPASLWRYHRIPKTH